jgi:hypothetical protein
MWGLPDIVELVLGILGPVVSAILAAGLLIAEEAVRVLWDSTPEASYGQLGSSGSSRFLMRFQASAAGRGESFPINVTCFRRRCYHAARVISLTEGYYHA